MTWESAKYLCANILEKMIGKAPVLCSTRVERRTKDRWEAVMSTCEDHIHLMNTYDPRYTFTASELARLVAQCVVTVDAIRQHEVDEHKSLEE